MAAKKIKRKIRRIDALIAIVICSFIILVFSFMIYSYLGENKTIEGKLQVAIKGNREKQADLVKSKTLILAISRLIGWRAEDKNLPPEGGWTDEESLKDTLNKWVEKLKEDFQVDKYRPWDDGADNTQEVLNTVVLIDEIEKLTVGFESQIEDIKQQIKTHRQGEDEVVGTKTQDGAIKKIEQEKNKEIKSLRENIDGLEKRIAQIVKQGEASKENLVNPIRQKTEKIIQTAKENETKILALKQETIKYEERLAKLRRRLDIAEQGIQIDGEIIMADIQNGYAYVDIGQKDTVQKGLEFDLFSIQQGGVRKYKGQAKLVKIYDSYSQLAFIPQTIVPTELITIGDYIDSPIYSRKKIKIFSFAGQLIGKYTPSELRDKIKQVGGKVLDEITDEITYVVVGEGYENDENYKKAVQLGALVMREKELYGLIGLEWKN
ncbi:MAG: BRCT domain-containing protein [Planctomycetota bacterium]